MLLWEGSRRCGTLYECPFSERSDGLAVVLGLALCMSVMQARWEADEPFRHNGLLCIALLLSFWK